MREKEEAGERIVALMDAFEMSREEQAKALESKQLELDVSAFHFANMRLLM